MKVWISDINADMELGNKGVILKVYDNDDTYKGKLRLGKGKIEWCKGKTNIGNGKTANWDELIEFFNSNN